MGGCVSITIKIMIKTRIGVTENLLATRSSAHGLKPEYDGLRGTIRVVFGQ